MKKVLILTYYWPPSGGAGVQRSLKFVKYLPAFGIQPYVLTVAPSDASYPVLDPSLALEVPAGLPVYTARSFEVLKLLSLFTAPGKIPHGGFANEEKESSLQKLMRFVRGNFFIPDARKAWIGPATDRAAELLEKEDIHTVYISSPPHSSQLIGLELKRKFPSLRWIADMRDPWTDIYYYSKLMHTAPARRKDAAYESAVLESADVVLSVSASIRTMFIQKTSADPGKFHVLPNGFDEEDFAKAKPPVPGPLVITYVGSMAPDYRPEIFFRAVKRLAELHPGEVKLRMVGTFAASARLLSEDALLSQVTEFIPTVPHHLAVTYMQESTVLFLAIPDVENSAGILTGKLFEYLASRRPILALGPVDGDAAAILNECSAGRMFDRSDGETLYNELASLFSRWKGGDDLANASTVYKKYARKNLTQQLASYL